MAQADFQPTWSLIKRPKNFPIGPASGKNEMLWRANSKSLYHRLSPYTDYDMGLFGKLLGDTEPFYYIFPDQTNQFPNSALKYDSRLFPLGSATIDVIRTAKFLVSGRGLTFLAKQALLQTGNAFNETRIYNPTSPIVAAGLTLTLGTARPMRMFDTSAGLAGIATALLGDLGGSIFGAPKTNPVSGTASDINSNALPDVNKTSGNKGLLRAGTALRAQAHLQTAWPAQTGGNGSSGGFMNAVANLATSLFQNFIPQTQKNILYRSDEGAYGMMVGAGDAKFSYSGNSQDYGFGQMWMAGKSGVNGIRKLGEYPNSPYRIFVKYDNGVLINYANSATGGFSFSIPTIGAVGIEVAESTNERRPGYRYGDSVGVNKSPDFEASEMMVQYKFYADPSQKFPTKDPEASKPDVLQTKNSLDRILNNIRAASEETYTVTADTNAVLLMTGATQYNYDRLFNTRDMNQGAVNYELGALKAYRDSGVRLVSNDLTSADKSLKLPTAGKYDAINTLNVLDGDRKTNSDMANWTTWEPYKDDLIALYFYDVVNDKYIPFRAAIKGLSESGNASWEELPFIGRADKVYSYGGFNRNASFTIQIVISSIKELAPTWQRINYMATSYKPANYTKSKYVSNGSQTFDRFMVPPMFFLTLGDFYRDQPILIQSLVVTIPDDASWETQNEDNSSNWSYLAGLIKAPKVRYGQVPREVELGFTVTLLEKERALVGGANFGHAPRTDDFGKYNTNTPNGKTPNKFNQSLLKDVMSS